MFQRYSLRQRPDRRLLTFRQTPNRQQHKVLLWFKTRRACHHVSVVQKLPDTVPEFGQPAVFVCRDTRIHVQSVS